MTDRAQIILTVTGLDRPGITAEICRVLDAAQADLVEVLGRFQPRIVRMASEPGDT